MAPPRADFRWVAPAIVAALAIAGAHPFCNFVFHCGCGALTLTAHCNIHAASPPHCPWCAQPAWFALAAALALVFAALAMRLVRRQPTAIRVIIGVVGVIAGASLGALVTR